VKAQGESEAATTVMGLSEESAVDQCLARLKPHSITLTYYFQLITEEACKHALHAERILNLMAYAYASNAKRA
jgi:hypothetical protein